MVLIPERDTTLVRIYNGYEERQRKDPPRTHLGASEIGRECERQIWYNFRWVKSQTFSGQLLRLFDTGKLAENRFINDLSSVGVDVRPFDLKTGYQYRITILGGHFGGSFDGICIGLVEAPLTWHILEAKTHNDKSFKALANKGVQESKPEHYAQMQVYMGMTHEQPLPDAGKIDRAFYFAVNKNTDDLYTERIYYDPKAYKSLKEKAERVIYSNRIPPRISRKPDFFQCKWCNFNKICHGTSTEMEVPEKNCRTCIHSTATQDGKWKCEKWDKILSRDEQKAGCEKHLYVPQLFPLVQTDATDDSIIYEDSNGKRVINYEGGEVK